MSPVIEFTPGIPKTFEIEFNQGDGSPLYLLDCEIEMDIKDGYNSNSYLRLSKENGIEVVGSSSNILKGSISSIQTANILSSSIFDIKITFPDGNVDHYPREKEERPGIFRLVPRVTV